jgi:uncharacterized membrane protein
MADKLSKQQELVIDYLYNNYYDDCETMANIRMVKEVIAIVGKPEQIASNVDKVALFNDIKKSHPPKKPLAQKIVEGIGFIMYGQ